jgi:hypothetical protein
MIQHHLQAEFEHRTTVGDSPPCRPVAGCAQSCKALLAAHWRALHRAIARAMLLPPQGCPLLTLQRLQPRELLHQSPHSCAAPRAAQASAVLQQHLAPAVWQRPLARPLTCLQDCDHPLAAFAVRHQMQWRLPGLRHPQQSCLYAAACLHSLRAVPRAQAPDLTDAARRLHRVAYVGQCGLRLDVICRHAGHVAFA